MSNGSCAAASPPAAARGTHAVELDAMIEHFEAGANGDPPPRAESLRGRNVEHPPAREAREMIMTLDVAVEAQAVHASPLQQQPLRGEPPKVAIDRREAHARQAAPDPPVHERRGRMGVGRADHVEDDAPGPRQPKPEVAQRVDRLVSNNYQLMPAARSTRGAGRVSSASHLARSVDFQ